jgi:hypothetical protein
MRAKELIDYLTAGGFNVFPDPNFIPADIPESQLPALFVFGTGGFESHKYLPLERPTFQVIIKGKSYKSNPLNMDLAEQEAKRLIDHLDKETNYLIGTSHVYESIAMQSNPIPLGLDPHDLPMFSTNFRFRVREV